MNAENRTKLAVLLALLGASAQSQPAWSDDNGPSLDEALHTPLVIECIHCLRTQTVEPDSALQDPVTGEWFGIVDSPGKCTCGEQRWRYLR